MGACAQIAVFTFAYTANCQQLLYPFSRLNVGTDDRSKLLCALLLPQRGHRRQGQASLHPSSASAWAQVTEASFSVPLNQDVGHYTQDLIITPRAMKTTGA